MAILTILCLCAGVIAGRLFGDFPAVALLPQASDYVLYLLILSAGIGVGCCKTAFSQLRVYRLKILLYPAAVIFCSLIGGALCSAIPGAMNLRDSLATAAGTGWYSLIGTVVADLSGDAAVGTIAFLANLFRDFFAFILLPLLSKRLGAGAGIAMAGSSAQDTALPLIVRCGGKEIAIPAVISGIVCTFAVPILARIIYFF